MDPLSVLQLGALPSASERLLGFALGVLVGGFALFLSSRYLAELHSYDHAVLTAIIGALTWSLLSPIQFLGPVIALFGWVSILKWRYPVDWLHAGALGAGAWVTAMVVVAGLQLVGVETATAVGVPGT